MESQCSAASIGAITWPNKSGRGAARIILRRRHHPSRAAPALVNGAEADAAICCWQAKYSYVLWRPITAIAFADLDGNAATAGDPTWIPLLITPAHPEYPSGHSSASGATTTVLAAFFGDNNDFT